jgi:hypothetical protein
MTPKQILNILNKQAEENARMAQKIETMGRKNKRLTEKLTVQHFGGVENVPKRNAPKRSKRHYFKGSKINVYDRFPSDKGWWAYYENDMLTIGNSPVTGTIYYGPYLGEDTPGLSQIQKDKPKLYNSIKRFFEEDAQK